MTLTTDDSVVHTARLERIGRAQDADPITTEVIRHGLNSAAEAMKRTLMRTAMSPVIYEVLDFVPVLYDRHLRMLAQAPSLPLFMGSMGYVVENAVAEVGGEEALRPGDIILLNTSYLTGSHLQDATLVMPIFLSDGELVAYSAIKAHWMDIGAKAPYVTDSTDIFQEGVIFPGVKLYSAGEVVRDVMKIATANSRMPKYVTGDINAQVASVRTGAREVVRLVERFGMETFGNCVERMFDHGEAVMRDYISRLADGRYLGHGMMDDDGVTEDPVDFDVVLEIDGSTARVDLTRAPDAAVGPINCPVPTTISATRVIITMLAGGGEAPNEGHFRPIEVVTRPGSLHHALHPAPCFNYDYPALQATEALLRALGDAMPESVPASSGSDFLALVWFGQLSDSGDYWGDAGPHPVGLGASIHGDGRASRQHYLQAASRMTPVEIWEARDPFVVERFELATDSGGAGRFRGGLGPDIVYRLLEDAQATTALAATKHDPPGLNGGHTGRTNSAELVLPDGSRSFVAKVTGLPVPRDATLIIRGGGGGGWGDPTERDRQAVLDDVRDGYVSEEAARRDYPHAFR